MTEALKKEKSYEMGIIMKNKKIIAVLTAVTILLSGCSFDKKQPTAVPTVPVTPTVIPDPTETPTPTPSPKPVYTGKLNDATYTTVYDVPKGTACEPETLTTRAFIAVNAEPGILLSWRSFGDTSETFTVKKGENVIYTGSNTNFLDETGVANDVYTLTYTENGETHTETANAWAGGYQEFTLSLPPDTPLPNNHMSKHYSNDMSVGDLDGDGELELIVKWQTEDAQDNAASGWTGCTIIDGYDLDINTGKATLMWRIDLGINIRAGAHYTQYQVWDYDGDGIAELMVRTSDGTTAYNSKLEEIGHVGNASMSTLDSKLTRKKQDYDYRETADGFGRVLSGPEYLTVFKGSTGEIIDSVDYIPERGPEDSKGKTDMNSWGDNYGNRVDRFLAATAYIDDGSPAAIFCRGYYSRTAITAWKLIDGKLTLAWYFDCPGGSPYAGQGNHNLSVNDVDGDGYDEIIYGSLCIDNDGDVLYTTRLGHGDAMHVSDWNGDGKLEVLQVHEDTSVPYLIELHDAETGELIWGVKNYKDTGRGMAADIDPRYPGAEMWGAANNNTYDCNGNVIYTENKPSVNFSIFWDGDLLMELFDYNNQTEYTPEVQKWDYKNEKTDVLLSMKGATVNNGTKGNAGLVADIYGDWREEVIVRDANDASKIRIYSTTIPTEYTIPCLLTDRAYREGVAWQNTAYNQPANLTTLLSKDVTAE